MLSRQIILVKTVLLVLSFVVCGMAGSIGAMMAASLLMGISATLAQDIVPAAAHLASPQSRGKVVGTVMTGLLLGILLSRVASGIVAEQFGWRVVYDAAAISIALFGVQAALVAHQTIVFGIAPEARSRANALLVTCMFLGMAAGSVLGSMILARWDWMGVMVFAITTALAALAVRLVHSDGSRSRAPLVEGKLSAQA